MILGYFVFDGIDGSGKTTMISRLSESLEQRGVDVLVVREPYDYPAWCREQLERDDPNVSAGKRAWRMCYLYQLGRMAMYDEIIHPLVTAPPKVRGGRSVVVLQDRSFLSTMAYQGRDLVSWSNQQGLNFSLTAFWRQICDSVMASMLPPDRIYLFDRSVGSDEADLRRVSRFYKEAVRFLESHYAIDFVECPDFVNASSSKTEKFIRSFLDEHHYWFGDSE